MVNFTIQELVAAIDAYQMATWKATCKGDLSGVSGKLTNVRIYERPRGFRQIVVPAVHQMPRVHMSTLLPEIGQAIANDTQLPENVLVVCPIPISLDVQQTMAAMMRTEYQVELSFLGSEDMMGMPEFESLFSESDEGVFTNLDETHKMLYNMLGEGQNADDIKNSLVCSVIVFSLDEKDGMGTDELISSVQEKLGKEVGSLQQEIRYLQRNKRIVSSKANKDYLSLSDKEKENIRVAKEKSNKEERAFYAEFHALLDQYGIHDKHEQLFAKMCDMYKSRCGVQLDQDSPNAVVGSKERTKKAVEDFQQFVQAQIQEPAQMKAFMNQMKELCQSNSFLSRVGASESFLSLYRSKRLAKYLGSKHKRVYLDTKVFVYYFCSKSGLLQGRTDWNDHGYRSTVNLMRLRNSKKLDVKFYISDDYLGEVVGELKKALRTAWFAEGYKFAIPYETSNTFYNYYRFLLDEGHLEDNGKINSFNDFVKSLGFEQTNPEHKEFDQLSKSQIIARLKMLGIQVVNIPFVPETFFKEALKEYDEQLMLKGKSKTMEARKADVRQCINLSQESGSNESDYYFCSWDYTTIGLRNWLIDKDAASYSPYSIYNPGRIANKFSLSNFNISAKSITDDLFFYADNHYRVTEKIRSLYDDTIIPLFGYIKRDDLQALNFILDLQKKYMMQSSKEMTDEEPDAKLPLEIIFNGIKQKLQDDEYTEQELSNFLNDKSNLAYLKKFFTAAFKEVSVHRNADAAIPDFIETFREYIKASNAEEVKIPL